MASVNQSILCCCVYIHVYYIGFVLGQKYGTADNFLNVSLIPYFLIMLFSIGLKKVLLVLL